MVGIDYDRLHEVEDAGGFDGRTVAACVPMTDGGWAWRRIDVEVLARHNPGLLDEVAG